MCLWIGEGNSFILETSGFLAWQEGILECSQTMSCSKISPTDNLIMGHTFGSENCSGSNVVCGREV